MSDITRMTVEELETELRKKKAIFEDIQHERAFLGKQVGMHIVISEFERLDREAEAAQRKISELERALADKRG